MGASDYGHCAFQNMTSWPNKKEINDFTLQQVYVSKKLFLSIYLMLICHIYRCINYVYWALIATLFTKNDVEFKISTNFINKQNIL